MILEHDATHAPRTRQLRHIEAVNRTWHIVRRRVDVNVNRVLQRARGRSGIGWWRRLRRPRSETGCARRDESGQEKRRLKSLDCHSHVITTLDRGGPQGPHYRPLADLPRRSLRRRREGPHYVLLAMNIQRCPSGSSALYRRPGNPSSSSDKIVAP